MLKENFNGVFEEAIRRNWNLPAFTDYGGATLSYREVGRWILTLHGVFKKSRIKPGDKIALCGRNSSNWAITYMAVVTYGAIVVPILSDFHTEDIQHIINHSRSRYLFLDKSIYIRLDEEMMPAVEAIFSLEDFQLFYRQDKHLRAQKRESQKEVEKKFKKLTPEKFSFSATVENDQIAALIYTSGTTGFSKGVLLPYNSLLANVLFAQDKIDLEKNAPVLSLLPLAHSYPCTFEFLFPLSLGCHIVFLGQLPSPRVLLQAFAEVKPRLIFFVPLIMEKVYKKRIAPLLEKGVVKGLLRMPGLSSLLQKKFKQKLREAFGGNFEVIIIGGAALNGEVEDFLKSIRFPFSIGYGMTECGPLISYSPWDEVPVRSVGKPITYLQLKIDSPDPRREVGEIMVKGENVMRGYYKNEEATREMLDEDGWLHTGDLGLLDEEGNVYIKGRSKNLLLGPSGQNIYPEEIESKLNNLPFIQESIVLEDSGSLIALVYPDWEAVDALKGPVQDGEKWLAKRMEENRLALRKQLPGFVNITRIRLQPEPFEKTPTQKIKRFLYQTKAGNSA